MRAYYGSRFSPNMTATPEGFLIAHNVPIARTGEYDYLGEEVGAPELTGKTVKVYRTPEEVFNAAAIASFEGKPAVDEHPPEAVTPDNAMQYVRGSVQNVRQGKGDESDLLLADIIIYDEYLIRDVMDGKREVSCGYDTNYIPQEDGTYLQAEIRGNHVAVVSSGRAGPRVSIKDHKPKGEQEKMSKKVALPRKHSRVTDFLAAVGLKQFAMDAEPEEIREAVDAMAEEKVTEDSEKTEGMPAQDSDVIIKSILDQLKSLSEAIAKLESRTESKTEDSAEKSLDDAISALEKPTGDDANEESHTVEPDAIDGAVADPIAGPVASPDERTQHVIDNGYKVAALRAIKPILAAMTDPIEKKRVADAAIASIKSKPKSNTYAAISKGQKAATTDAQAKDKQQQDIADLGKKWAAQYNPHYKKPNEGVNV